MHMNMIEKIFETCNIYEINIFFSKYKGKRINKAVLNE